MRIGLTGQSALSAVTRTGLVAITLLITAALAACTTVEGTNALVDPGTFEREVMTSTAQGLGLVGKSAPKQEPSQARAPLALPRDETMLPQPTTSLVGSLPQNSDTVQLDVSEADLAKLRAARVVDLRSMSGRPLTADETRMIAARMQAGHLTLAQTNGKRPLYLPPDDYFTVVGGRAAICKTETGQLVPITSRDCPQKIRDALQVSPSLNDANGGLAGSDINNTMGLGNSTRTTGLQN